ncbi:MAG: hydroxymethylbilane synthase [Candidatus Binatus sp.]|uniref:hydroxymethylbilane synthase n=1 Tax=Candidatus Binatus sp. TaxID=2811406 RepID=UPI002721CC09|nr:hydroxymethylbilane synthase [Candidatus Binatus sp.]MDO8431808.1 hydroxymethylbilane synthase [Candidatus Binatus sp.]
MPSKIRIGSRPSKLALAQAEIVKQKLAQAMRSTQIEIVEIRTSGDKMTTASLAQVGGKGLFIKELEQALADRSIDLAIHSMKDLPAESPEQFRIAAVPNRENTADVLVTREGVALAALKPGARLGTSSLRRRFQALRINRSIEVVLLRGNVDTRLKRVAEGELDAIIVAIAGLKRLGRIGDVNFVELPSRDFIPCGGQGALAIETLAERRAGAISELDRALTAINDSRAFYETAAERGFLAALGASCTTPVGVKASIAGSKLSLDAILFSPDGSRELSESLEEEVDTDLAPAAAASAGERLAEKILARGGAELLPDE